MIFDGRILASEIEDRVAVKVRQLKAKPKVVSLVVGSDGASLRYSKLKQECAKRVGIEFEILALPAGTAKSALQKLVRELGQREDVSGVMIQLPLPGFDQKDQGEIVELIPDVCDVDGMMWERSGVVPATVRAVLSVCEEIAKNQIPNSKSQTNSNTQTINRKTESELWKKRFVVLGAKGAVGRPLVYFLRSAGVEVEEVEWDTPNPELIIKKGEVVISCVGKPGLVTGEMVREGVVAIDVGMSRANSKSEIRNSKQIRNSKNKNLKQFDVVDLENSASLRSKVVGDMTREVYLKASVAVPVPFGVGPVTIASLMENTLERYVARK